MTKKDETSYGDSISFKNYCKDLRKIELINSDEQTKLAIEAQGGNVKSMQKLVNSNLRFVLSIAREYMYTGVPLEDLISEGNIGLIKATERFDASKGFKFISYAVWWIRQSILQSVNDNGSSVRLPVNRISAINKVFKATEALSKELHRDPTPKEISDFYKDKETGSSDLSEKDINSAYSDGIPEISLNSKFPGDTSMELHETLEGSGLVEIENVINKKSLQNEINNVLCELTDRESMIIKMYFGIDGYNDMTLTEIGLKINLTNERVRQIKEFAFKKLRTFKNSSKLKEFLSCEII